MRRTGHPGADPHPIERPKPLLEVGGRPMLHHVLEVCAGQGLTTSYWRRVSGPTSSYGTVDADRDGRVHCFQEKRRPDPHINAGFFVFEQRAFDL